MSDQNSWRYCGKCHGLFYDGYPEKGKCPGGEGHEAIGWNFRLLYDVPGSPTAQTDWRFCGNCNGLFFNGYPDKGVCPSGGAHSAIGFVFVMPHEIPESSNDQPDWRFCGKCHGLFFDGYPDKGKCPSGGGHEAQGYNFVLPHWITPTVTLERVQDENGRFYRANGWAFTPNSGVTLLFEFWKQGETNDTGWEEATDNTSVHGEFSYDFHPSWSPEGVNVGARDDVTGTTAGSSV